MDTILIADAGSTKTNWVLVNSKKQIYNFHTQGFNPISHDISAFSFPKIDNPSKIAHIYYYGSGVIGQSTEKMIGKHLSGHFAAKNVSVHSDLLAAARGTLGDNYGGIGILGTGSNSAYYDGKSLYKNTPSLGFILGDEGSGVDIGKKVLRDFYYGRMPDSIDDLFEKKYAMCRETMLKQLKSSCAPSKYLAGFASFLIDIEGNWKNNILLESFKSFFELRRKDFQTSSQNCIIGSVGYAYQDILKKAAEKVGVHLSKIVKDPMSGLINYHIQEKYG